MSFISKTIDYCKLKVCEDIDVLEYLSNRNITKESIDKFKLGAFPKNLDTLKEDLNFTETDKAALKDLKIIQSWWTSQFSSHKLIFPISDQYSGPIAFAGRPISSDKSLKQYGVPKYYNTKYKKNKFLYGFDLAKEHIRENDFAIVVEGYFDVIMAHQCDIKNVVAVCGISLSSTHVSLLSRYTKNIYLMFDDDEAGQRALENVVQKRLRDRTNFYRCNMPEGKYNDLDDLLRSIDEMKPQELIDYLKVSKINSI